MKFLIQKSDLDTVLTGLLLGWQDAAQTEVVADQAPAVFLADPTVYCIECGGSGQVARRNFDHHDTVAPLPPACVQAYCWMGYNDPAFWSLVRYVAAVDLGQQDSLPERDGLSLSGLFSGLLMVHGGMLDRFTACCQVLRTILHRPIDPWGVMPRLPAWEDYREAKRAQHQALEK